MAIRSAEHEQGPLESLVSKLIKLGLLGLVAAGGVGIVESFIHTNPSALKTIAGRVIEGVGGIAVAGTALNIIRE